MQYICSFLQQTFYDMIYFSRKVYLKNQFKPQNEIIEFLFLEKCLVL